MQYRYYQHRLSPLLVLEQRLIALLSDEEKNNERERTHLTTTWSASSPSSDSVYGPKEPSDWSGSLKVVISRNIIHPSSNSPLSPHSTREISVKSTSNWKKTLSLDGQIKSPNSPHPVELEGWWDDPYDPVHIINQCAPAMFDLWKDPDVKQQLTERGLLLEESSGLCVPSIISNSVPP